MNQSKKVLSGILFIIAAQSSFAVELPERAIDAKPASVIIDELINLETEYGGVTKRFRTERDRVFKCEVKKGNVPSFSRSFTGISTSCGQNEVTFFVSSDYLAIGSDDDLLPINVGADTAQELADALGFMLPTRNMVKIIYSVTNSSITNGAVHMIDGRGMREEKKSACHFNNAGIESTKCLRDYEKEIFGEKISRAAGRFYIGYKKDIVQVRTSERASQVAIFGWRIGGEFPIQPYSTVHEAPYSDYSHGLRMVKKEILINGEEALITDSRANCLFDVRQSREMKDFYTSNSRLDATDDCDE